MPSPTASASGSGGDRSPSPVEARRIVVTHRLPLRAEPNPDAMHGFDFSLDADALPLQLSRGLPRPVVFVGVLPFAAASIPASEELAADLLARFSCSPVFLGVGLHKDFYDGFCKHYLWPMLHYLLPLTPYSVGGGGLNFNAELYRAYLTANTQYADRVYELLSPDEDLVFIHDYHLWALPTILRHKSPRARIGFFLHSPFPSSELFRAIPVREELLRALLNADLVGFHTYDYARHFLSACCRILGVNNHSRRGYIGIDYYGRAVVVKILSAGVDMSQLQEVLSSPVTAAKAKEIATKFAGRQVLLGVDDIDLFKGIGLKLLAMEKLLETRKELRGLVVLVQINNPARSPGPDIDLVRSEAHATRDRINDRFSLPGYDPIVMIDDPLTMHEKLAFYTAADICIVTAVRDGLNRIPYIYTVCRQEGPIAGAVAGAPRQSAIVLSEFVGCSPSMSGALRVNPWNVDDVAEGMSSALMLNERDRQMRQDKHYRYVLTHDVAYWGRSLDQDLQRASKDHASMNILSVGLAMKFRVVVLGANFQKLSPGDINPSYKRTSNRLILLDYDGTVMPEEIINRYPSEELIRILNDLCSDPKNTVFVVSGRRKDELAGWLGRCRRLGLSAEHGYFTRWNGDSPWESANLVMSFHWKKIAEPVMNHYTEVTDGSYIEAKETALVWHYEEADPDFGSRQAKELQDHLHSVLSKEPVSVKTGHKIVEVNPQDVGKGTAVRNLIATMGARGSLPDFILCVGDDGSDEDMFAAITKPSDKFAFPEAAEIFACTLGNKPSQAKYYLEDSADVLKMLKGLTVSSRTGGALQSQVSFEDPFE
ncbi:Alpha,alpha-trehalose-phosphate synthase [UDP-forming] 5 [Dichanthelium oligosanthes]|uniref:Alpha,alpha-trehalose-phosphate synthase [UDP-forming] 5 n=1 Tax=Dichanthelium oligosanthes TaxID=888268 RepID=A0A1E5W8B9_9POAL|nr:Alpha,alpha-trehalose-phosphate synthase [UDP-forming] 5 [Dichanthelium oligosanthes]